LHVMAPSDLELLLPSLTQNWRSFLKSQEFDSRWVSSRDNDRRVGPQEWLAGISASDRQPPPYYLHALQPHQSHMCLPHRQTVVDDGRMAGLDREEQWSEDEWPVVQVYQRHLLQVRYVDRLVGEMVQRLKHEGLWDRSLVIVTAD